MKTYWLLLSLLLCVNNGEFRVADQKIACVNLHPKRDAVLRNKLSNIHALILRDIKLANPLSQRRNSLKMNGIANCKSAIKTVNNLAKSTVTTMLDIVLQNYSTVLLFLPSPHREHFWQTITARGYANAQIFLDDLERVNITAQSKRLIRGQTIVTTARNQKPSITFTVTKDNQATDLVGDSVEILAPITKAFGFNYTLIPATENQQFVNGSWKGPVGMLVRKEAVMNLQPYNFDWERNTVIDFSFYATNVAFTLTVPYPKEKRSLLASTWPFTPTVWLCLLVTMAVITLTLTMFAYVKSTKISIREAASQSLMYTYGLITCQGLECPGRAHKSRMVAGIWGMAGLLFVYTYNSQLTSYLTVPQLTPLVNSMEELALTNKLEFLAMSGSNYFAEILSVTYGPYKLLGDRIRNNLKEHFAVTYEEAFEKVVAGTHAFAVNDYTATHYGNIMFQKSRTCSLMIIKQPMKHVYCVYMIQKGSPYGPAINDGIQRLTEGGITSYIMKYSGNGLPRFLEHCKVPVKDFPANIILTLSQLESAFAILGIGLLAGLVALLCELINFKVSSCNG